MLVTDGHALDGRADWHNRAFPSAESTPRRLGAAAQSTQIVLAG